MPTLLGDKPPDSDSTTLAGSWPALAGWWLVSVLVAILHNGIWATPNLGFMSAIAENPGSNPFSEALPGDYLLTSLLMPMVGTTLGQTDPHELARLHLFALLAGWAAVVFIAHINRGYRTARTLTVLLAAAPLTTVSMQWLGQPDPVTGLCGVAMVLVRRRWAVIVLGVIAGLAHPEQALFMAAVAGVIRVVLNPAGETPTGRSHLPDKSHVPDRSYVAVLYPVMGVVIGRVVTEVYFRAADITIGNPRSDYLDMGLSKFADHHAQEPFALIWTLWGPLWLVIAGVILAAITRGRDSPERNRTWYVIGALAVTALIPMFVTLDETRVYAVITAPLIAAAAVLIGSWKQVSNRLLMWSSVALLLVTLVLPGGFATGITSWRSQLQTADMAEFLVSGDIPEDANGELGAWLIAPFELNIPDVED